MTDPWHRRPPIPPLSVFGAANPETRTPQRHARRLALLERLPKHAVGAEVGVFGGAFTLSILRVTRPRQLYLIDPWEMGATIGGHDDLQPLHGDAAVMRGLREQVEHLTAGQPGVQILRGFSHDLLAAMPDDGLDWVYLDGDHRFDGIWGDLLLAAVKVREGGLISGDDLLIEHGGIRPVRRAVKSLFHAAGLPAEFDKIGQQFLFPVSAALKEAARARLTE